MDVFDTLTGEPVRVPFDRVVLDACRSSRRRTPRRLRPCSACLRTKADFLAEPRMRLRPGRYADPGIYVLGSVHQPADTAEALFQAYLTRGASRRAS